MPMSKEEHENLLKEIANTGGDTANMLSLMQRLRDDFDERVGMLRVEDESTDKTEPNDKEEKAKTVSESKEDNKLDKGERRDPLPSDVVARSEYDELKRKYIDRFFSTPDEAKRDIAEDTKRDGKKQTYEDLFKDKEG